MATRAPLALRKLKSIWRDQICRDNELRPSAFKIGYVMADYMTLDDSAKYFFKSGKLLVWPSQETLQKRTGISADTIRTSIAQMIDHGHLRRTKRGNQHTGSNTYRIVVREQSQL